MPAPDLEITLTDQPADDVVAGIVGGLVAANREMVGPANRRPLAVVIRLAGALQGGLIGTTAWGWLLVEKLWLAETLRGRGLAGRLLADAEHEAIRRGCHGAWIDTFNPVARQIYERHGYAVFGELADFPIGRSRVFLRKRLGVAPTPQGGK